MSTSWNFDRVIDTNKIVTIAYRKMHRYIYRKIAIRIAIYRYTAIHDKYRDIDKYTDIFDTYR